MINEQQQQIQAILDELKILEADYRAGMKSLSERQEAAVSNLGAALARIRIEKSQP